MKNRKISTKLILFTYLGLFVCSAIYAGTLICNSKFQFEIENIDFHESSQLQDGDVIFHISKSNQSTAIQIATKSKYSHCGIIYTDKGKIYVLEAVQPVKITPFKEWTARGKNGHYVVKRLKNAGIILTDKVIKRMKQEGENLLGKNYDTTFEWSDNKFYCSELIWKLYKKTTGIEIGKLQKLKDFDISNEKVKKIMSSRYGSNIPLDEIVISPASIFNSDKLVIVEEN